MASSGIATLAGGASGVTYTVSTAVWTEKTLHYHGGHNHTRVHTMVDIADVT